MTDDELANKFRECAAWGGLPKAKAETIVDMIFGLEKLKNVRDLTRLLHTGPAKKKKPAAKKHSVKTRRR
jgi:hypothetical protein